MSVTGGKRYNLNIIDLEGRTSLFLKSILIGSDCRVSISDARASARAKLETGLFDGAIVDLDPRQDPEEMLSLIQDSVPAEQTFPVGTITDDTDVRLSAPELTIERPVRIHRFQQLVRRMKNRMIKRRSAHRQQVRSAVSCRIQFHGPDRTIPVSSVALNSRGLLASVDNDRELDLNNARSREQVDVLLSLPDSDEEFTLSGEATFTESGSNDAVTGIGLEFASGDDRVHRTIDRLRENGALRKKHQD